MVLAALLSVANGAPQIYQARTNPRSAPVAQTCSLHRLLAVLSIQTLASTHGDQASLHAVAAQIYRHDSSSVFVLGGFVACVASSVDAPHRVPTVRPTHALGHKIMCFANPHAWRHERGPSFHSAVAHSSSCASYVVLWRVMWHSSAQCCRAPSDFWYCRPALPSHYIKVMFQKSIKPTKRAF